MIKKLLFLVSIAGLFTQCTLRENAEVKMDSAEDILDIKLANKLAKLPQSCISNPFPYKSGITIAGRQDLALPQEHHPAFYGCFDWHSAVHGHWSLVYLLKKFPNLENSYGIRQQLDANITEANIQKEIAYFTLNKWTHSFERTYGWAWLLKLSEELETWEDPDAKRWSRYLRPFSEMISEKYIDYLPKLVYPIRVGEHSNTALGLSMALDYARVIGDTTLNAAILERAKSFYADDKGCPITWEPSGYDFLSPCLQEVDLMRKVLSPQDFSEWLVGFMPSLSNGTLDLEPAIIKDRSDGKLVHLDGLNFSRAWCLYPLASVNPASATLAEKHLRFSLDQISDGDYMGEHWLGTFALYAIKARDENK